jgi:hypothetical protein
MLATNSKTRDDLDSILKELKTEDFANAVPESKVLELRKKMNPYGRTIEGSDCVMNFSITQISHEYWRNYMMMGIATFLHRMCDEDETPEGLPIVTVYEYLDDPSKLDTPKEVLAKNIPSIIYDYEFNRKKMEERKIIKSFLERYLQFNPEEHVRSAYRPNRKDPDRKSVDTPAGKTAVNHLMKMDKEFKSEETAYNNVKAMKDSLQAVKEQPKTRKVKKTIINKKTGQKKVIETEVPVEQDADLDPSLNRNIPPTHEISKERVLKSNKGTDVIGKDPNLPYNARAFIPPADTFHRLKIYMSENYEELRKATDDLFCQKTQLELAINPYSWHTGDKAEEEAEAFRKKHSEEVIAEIFPAHSGKWNFFDSWKEQRESTNFYNPNTVVLEEIVKQVERDERLGQDMMKKRVHNQKKKNIIETGPDAESFKKWRDQNPELKKLGAQHVSSTADEDCPENAVQVDIWRLSKTGQQLTKDKMFTQAEAPTFVKEAQDKAKAEAEKGPAPPTPQQQNGNQM